MSGDPYEVLWLRDMKLKTKFVALLRRVDFDVVHFDTLGLAQYMPLIGSSGAILNHHDVQSVLMTRRWNNETNPLLKWFLGVEAKKLRRAERRWGGSARVNLVCSHDEAKLLSKVTSSAKTTVVANGVDIEYFSVRPDPGGDILLFCGSLDMYPNQDAMKYFFQMIWPRLAAERKNLEMYVVGRNPPEWLQRQTQADSRVRVTGFVDDVRPYFQQATICICPVREGGGTRLKILDSLAMGVPVIGTTFACSGLNLKHERHVLMADTPTDFARQTIRLLDNRSLRMRLASAGREAIEREFSWDVVGRNLLGAYEKGSRKQNGLDY
jgi:glycosyltransferase involved in cell wall biosynthesis